MATALLVLLASAASAEDESPAYELPILIPQLQTEQQAGRVLRNGSAGRRLTERVDELTARRLVETAAQNRHLTRALRKSDYDFVVEHAEGDVDAAAQMLSDAFTARQLLRRAYGLPRTNEGAAEVRLLPGYAEYDGAGSEHQDAHTMQAYQFMLMDDGSIERVLVTRPSPVGP